MTALPGTGYSVLPKAGASSGGLSTGAKVAIGIFVPLIVLSIFAGALLFFLRRRKQRLEGENSSPVLDKAVLHSSCSSSASDTLRVNSYMAASRLSNTSAQEDDLKPSKGNGLAPHIMEAFVLPQLNRSPSPQPPSQNRLSHVSMATAPDPQIVEAQAHLEANAPTPAEILAQAHRPQVSLTIPSDAHLVEPELVRKQHGDTPLLPPTPSPQQYHPQVELSRAMSPALPTYGYSRMQRDSREDLVAHPAFVAPLPPPTVDRPEPLRIRQSGPHMIPRALKRASSTPSLAAVMEVPTEDRYIVPPSTAEGDPTGSRPHSNVFPENVHISSLVAATFPASPAASSIYSDFSPMQQPAPIQNIQTHTQNLYAAQVQPLSVNNSARNTPSPQFMPDSPPRSRSALDRTARLDIDMAQPEQRSRSALDHSPTGRDSPFSDKIPYRPTTPQALPRVFSQKRTLTPVAPKMDLKSLPRLMTVPDYAGGEYGDDDSGSAVDVQDEEMFRRHRERKVLEERERRLEREVDARYSWRGFQRGHRPKSMSFG